MTKCCVKGCKSSSNKKDPNISFHRLPINIQTRTKWIQNIGRHYWNPPINTFICSLHFEKDCINKTLNVTRLKENSIPTIFPSHVHRASLPEKVVRSTLKRQRTRKCSNSSVTQTELVQDPNSLLDEECSTTVEEEVEENIVPITKPFMGRKQRKAKRVRADNVKPYVEKKHTDHNYSRMDIGALENAMSASIKDNLELGDAADNIDGTDALTENENVITEEPVVPDKAYSWENKKEAVPIPADIGEDYEDNLSMYCDDGASPPHTREPQGDVTLHQGYHCNVCDGEIRGFRYTCVQCNDFDLCSQCELNRAHHHHYVLRVPEPRPYVEIHSILSRIRRHLMQKMDPIGDPNQDLDDVVSIKSEIKSEDEDEETMKETTKEVAENQKNLEEADYENVTDDIDTDTVELNSSVTLRENVVHIKTVPTPSNSDVSREKQQSPTTVPMRLLVKGNMPQVLAKRICVMRVPSTRGATRQDGRRTSEDKSLTDWRPEAPDPLHIEQNASTKQTRSVYESRFPLDNR